MNTLCTLLDSLSKNPIANQQLDDIGNLIATVVRADLGRDSESLIANWAENNDDYIDFSFALRPEWLVGTPDDKQVKMRISIDTCDQSWYAYLVMDCKDGEIESWGEKEFNRSELEEYSMPVKSMLEVIHGQYDKKLHEENTKTETLLVNARKTTTLLDPHVEAIKTICKENRVNLFADSSLGGTGRLYVVPDCIEATDKVDENSEITLDRFPYINLDTVKFDQNYDFFTKIK
jgi:hypothetical protein